MSDAPTPEIFADDVCEILKQKDINTVVFNVNFLMCGLSNISSDTPESRSFSPSILHAKNRDAMKKYTNRLLRKCNDDNMNIVIELNVIEKKSSMVYKQMEQYNSTTFTTIMLAFSTNYYNHILSNYHNILGGLIKNKTLKENCAFIYKVVFEGNPHIDKVYSDNVYAKMLRSIKTKFNIFDTEICSIQFGHPNATYMNNIDLTVSASGDYYPKILNDTTKHVGKHNFTNDDSIRCKSMEIDPSKVCAVIDKTALTKEMYDTQLNFVKCLPSKYIIVLTKKRSEFKDGISFRVKK